MAQGNKLHGASRATLLENSIERLRLDECPLSGSKERDKLLVHLQSASTEKLKDLFIKQVAQTRHEMAWLVSAELTIRGIAPCFWGVPVIEKEWWQKSLDVDFILMVADLNWFVSTYPEHKPEWKRLNSMFQPNTKRFMDDVDYLWWDGRRTAGQIAKALNLSEQQQRECSFIQGLNVERWRYRLLKRLPIAQDKITASVREKDRRIINEQNATIKRRSDLWLCAELADWKPQQTADFYAMMTGEVLPRNVVSPAMQN